jgi:hypothetical protein
VHHKPACASQTCLCITSGEKEAACDALTAKGKPLKQITSGFSEPFANYAVFSVMYIKILTCTDLISLIIKSLKTLVRQSL